MYAVSMLLSLMQQLGWPCGQADWRPERTQRLTCVAQRYTPAAPARSSHGRVFTAAASSALCCPMAPAGVAFWRPLRCQMARETQSGNWRQQTVRLAIWRHLGANPRLMAPWLGAIARRLAPQMNAATWRPPKPEMALHALTTHDKFMNVGTSKIQCNQSARRRPPPLPTLARQVSGFISLLAAAAAAAAAATPAQLGGCSLGVMGSEGAYSLLPASLPASSSRIAAAPAAGVGLSRSTAPMGRWSEGCQRLGMKTLFTSSRSSCCSGRSSATSGMCRAAQMKSSTACSRPTCRGSEFGGSGVRSWGVGCGAESEVRLSCLRGVLQQDVSGSAGHEQSTASHKQTCSLSMHPASEPNQSPFA